jgi:hypothetical protein
MENRWDQRAFDLRRKFGKSSDRCIQENEKLRHPVDRETRNRRGNVGDLGILNPIMHVVMDRDGISEREAMTA